MTSLFRKTYALIDTSAIQNNVRSIRAHIPESSEVMAVVKADAYGHGIVETAQAALGAGATALTVALAEEAVALRKAGIDCRILVMGHGNEKQLALGVEQDLSQCVFTTSDILLLQRIASAKDEKAYIHLKIDTGMHRVGLTQVPELVNILDTLKGCPNVVLEGMFTHFACADEEDRTFAMQQNKRFLEFVEVVRKAGYSPKIHVANSAAAISLPEFSYDYVRFGISLYGYYPSPATRSDHVKLMPAMQVFAEIAHIKEVDDGSPIGYGCTYKVTGHAKIATVQIGYGDGYPRLLSNRGRMLVRTASGAQSANIVGRVCMDQTMIDITGMDGVNVGDSVVVLGTMDSLSIDADEIAAIAGTISYEVLLDFSSRVPRIYK